MRDGEGELTRHSVVVPWLQWRRAGLGPRALVALAGCRKTVCMQLL